MPIDFTAVFETTRCQNSVSFACSPVCFLIATGWGHWELDELENLTEAEDSGKKLLLLAISGYLIKPQK